MGVSVGFSIYNAPSIYESGQGGGGGGGGGSAIIGGRDYKTVTIGGITWLSENLDYKFSGCGIGGSGMPNTPNAWYYNDDEDTYGIDGNRKCGLLYNWHAVKFLNDNRANLIPGWHVPTNSEWDYLANVVGGTGVAGTRLKALDGSVNGSWPTGWNSINYFGFEAVPAGCRRSEFRYIDNLAFFWTANEYAPDIAINYYFDTSSTMYSTNFNVAEGYSVRLVKD